MVFSKIITLFKLYQSNYISPMWWSTLKNVLITYVVEQKAVALPTPTTPVAAQENSTRSTTFSSAYTK